MSDSNPNLYKDLGQIGATLVPYVTGLGTLAYNAVHSMMLPKDFANRSVATMPAVATGVTDLFCNFGLTYMPNQSSQMKQALTENMLTDAGLTIAAVGTSFLPGKGITTPLLMLGSFAVPGISEYRRYQADHGQSFL